MWDLITKEKRVSWASSIIVHTWGFHLKGPVYVSMLKPFSVVTAAVYGVLSISEGCSQVFISHSFACICLIFYICFTLYRFDLWFLHALNLSVSNCSALGATILSIDFMVQYGGKNKRKRNEWRLWPGLCFKVNYQKRSSFNSELLRE